MTNERDMLKKDVKRMERDKQLYGKNNNNNKNNNNLQKKTVSVNLKKANVNKYKLNSFQMTFIMVWQIIKLS